MRKQLIKKYTFSAGKNVHYVRFILEFSSEYDIINNQRHLKKQRNIREEIIMNFFKKLWPTPFRIKKGDIAPFLIQTVIFLVICTVLGWLIGLLAGFPIIGIVFTLVGSLTGIYSLVGLVLCVLKFCGAVK